MNDHLGSSESQLMLSPADTTPGQVVLSGNPSWLKAWPNRSHRQSSLALHIAYIGPRSERVLVKHLAVCPIPPGIVRDSRRVMEGNDPCPKQGGCRSPQISTILMSSLGPSLNSCQQLNGIIPYRCLLQDDIKVTRWSPISDCHRTQNLDKLDQGMALWRS
jgi:hypothetical protein